MIKIAIIDTHPIQYNSPLYKLLAKEDGLEVKVFYTWEQGAQKFDVGFGKEIVWDIKLTDGFDYTFVSNNGIKDRTFFKIKNPDLEDQILFWGATHVLINGWSYWSHLRSILSLKGKVKIIFRGDSHLLNETIGVKKLLRRLFLKLLYKNVDSCLYVGVNNKNYFLKHGVKENKLFFSPHAIDLDRFKNLKYQKNQIREDLNIPNFDRIILYAGKFIEVKNLERLIKNILDIKNPNFHLVLVGSGILENHLRDISKTSKNIHFMPFCNQSEMPSVYSSSDFFILPSTSETWGLSVNEAMACGLPVIVSENCGCEKDLLRDGENGFVIKENNIRDCLVKVSNVVDRDMKIMGAKSLEIISEYSYFNAIKGIKAAVINNINQ